MRKTLTLPQKDVAQTLKRTGIITYDPVRRDFKKSHKVHTMTVEFPKDDFDLYYQWYLRKLYGIRIQRPMYGTHMTIVSGNERIAPQNQHLWKKYQGQRVTVEHALEVRKFREFWFLDITKTADFIDMREELGLPRTYKFGFHITIGRDFSK